MNDSEIRAFVRGQLEAGEDTVAIIKQLVQRGVDKKAASRWVESVHSEILLEQGASPGERADSLLPAAVGGLVVAVVTGGLWALIAVAVRREIQFAALMVGLLCALSVLFFARGRRGLPCQLLSALCAAVGMLVGQYGLFFYRYQQALAEQVGTAAAEQLTPLSAQTFGAFLANLDHLLSGSGLIWMGLGMATAWGIPKTPLEPPVRPGPDGRSAPEPAPHEPPPPLS